MRMDMHSSEQLEHKRGQLQQVVLCVCVCACVRACLRAWCVRACRACARHYFCRCPFIPPSLLPPPRA